MAEIKEHKVTVTVETAKNGFILAYPTWKEVTKNKPEAARSIADNLITAISDLGAKNKGANPIYEVQITVTTNN